MLLTRKLALESARCNQATFSAAGRRQESTENETTVGRLQTGLSHALDCRLFQHLQFGATQQPKLSANTFGTEPPKGAKLAFNVCSSVVCLTLTLHFVKRKFYTLNHGRMTLSNWPLYLVFCFKYVITVFY